MRLAFLLALAACGTTHDANDEPCPTTITDGDSCSFSGRCWHDNTFSSCYSGWCTCTGGHVSCEALAPENGDACGDEPIVQCSYEGTLDCEIPPTAQACYCDEGFWSCSCACYGSRTTCPIDPCTLYPQKLQNAACSDHGLVCPLPGNGSCTCEQWSNSEWRFACR